MIDKYTPVTVDAVASASKRADAVVLFAMGSDTGRATVYEAHLDEPAMAALEAMLKADAVSGKANDLVSQVIDGRTPRRLITVGLGPRKSITLNSFRDAAGMLARWARQRRLGRLEVILHPGLFPDSPSAAAGAIAGALCTGFFQFDDFKGAGRGENGRASSLSAVIRVDGASLNEARRAVSEAVTIATAQNFARAVAAHPGNVIHPPALANLAVKVARSAGLLYRGFDHRQLQRMGMGGLLAVGMGSSQTPPRLIVLEWKGGTVRSRSPAPARPLLLVGKAITFDTGGISIKPRDGMQRMVYDKCGAMAVLGALLAIARLKLPVRVIGVLAAAENHVSATAYRPGDILRMYNGVTVEVTNTDAEGRLVLADALAWGIRTYNPSAVVDVATLTGGVVVALGREFAGLISTSDALCAQLTRAAEAVGEKVWRLPLGDEVREMMKSDHADIVNSAGRWAHPLQGGEFLRRFIPDDGRGVPWAHLDIAGVADSEKDLPQYVRGATGWGVRTLVRWVCDRVSMDRLTREAR